MFKLLFLLLSASLVVCHFSGYAQTDSDTSFVITASENAVKRYEKFIKGQSGLYNGSEYRTVRRSNEEHPFFFQDDWQWGSVDYNGQHYEQVPILYDIFTDELVTEHYHNAQEIVMVKSKVTAFHMAGADFINIQDPLPSGLPVTGFYEVVYNGPSMILTRHQKRLEEKIEQTELLVFYTFRIRHYLLKDETWYRISSKRELMKLFGDQKQEIRTYIKKNGLKLSKTNPEAYGKVAAYYDTLTSGKK